jgi:hypothetical protein
MNRTVQIHLDLSDTNVNLYSIVPPRQDAREKLLAIHSALYRPDEVHNYRCKLEIQGPHLKFIYARTKEDELCDQVYRYISEHLASLLVNSDQLDLLRKCISEGNQPWITFFTYTRERIYDTLHRDNSLLVVLSYLSELPLLSPELLLWNPSFAEVSPTRSPFVESLQQTTRSGKGHHASLRTLLHPYSSVVLFDPLVYHASPFVNNPSNAQIYLSPYKSSEPIQLLSCKGRVKTASIPVDCKQRKMISFLLTLEGDSIESYSSQYEVSLEISSVDQGPFHRISLTSEDFKQGTKLEEYVRTKGYFEQSGERFFYQS